LIELFMINFWKKNINWKKNVKLNVLDPDTIAIRDRIASAVGGWNLTKQQLSELDTYIKNLKIITGGIWNEELGYVIGGTLPMLWYLPQISVNPNEVTTKVFNLGTAGELGDGTFAGGDSSNMITIIDGKKKFFFASTSPQYVMIPFNPDIGFSGNDKFFNFVFIRPTAFPSESRVFAQSIIIVTRFLSSDKKAEIVLNNFTTNDRIKSTSTMVADSWYGLGFNYDGTTLKIHFNGVFENSTTPTGTYGGNTSVYIIGDIASTTTINGYLGCHLIYKNFLITNEIANKINSLFLDK